VNEATPRTPGIDVPDAKLLEGKETYGKRVAQSVLDQIKPEFASLQAKAAHADLAQRQAVAAEKGRQDAELRFAQRERLLQLEREKVTTQEKQLDLFRNLVANGGDKLLELQTKLRQHYEKLRDKKNPDKQVQR
jgi:uncharacterized coiled-coil protein SlyX